MNEVTQVRLRQYAESDTTTEGRVQSFLRDYPGATVSDIVGAISDSYAQVYRTLMKLKEDGIVLEDRAYRAIRYSVLQKDKVCPKKLTA